MYREVQRKVHSLRHQTRCISSLEILQRQYLSGHPSLTCLSREKSLTSASPKTLKFADAGQLQRTSKRLISARYPLWQIFGGICIMSNLQQTLVVVLPAKVQLMRKVVVVEWEVHKETALQQQR